MKPRLLLPCLLLLCAPLGAAAPLFNLTLPWDDDAETASSAAFLNDHVAGSRGFVGLTPDGHLQTTGGRLRFWGVNIGAGAAFADEATSAKVAGRLAKAGVNIVRYHLMDNTWGPNIFTSLNPDRSLDPTRLDALDHQIYAMAQRGIYANVNLLTGRPLEPGAELDPSILLINDWKARAVLGFFDPAQQALQRQYAADLLTHVNPYTGHDYAHEPAVAFVEVNNENGLVQAWLSRQLDALPLTYESMLKTQWNQWLGLKYGTQPLLELAWGSSDQPLGIEKLNNGSFALSTAGWTLEQHGAPVAVASASVVSEGLGLTPVAKIVVTSPGQQGWHVQFNQPGLSLVAGATYTLGFWAKASVARSVQMTLARAHTDYAPLGLDTAVALTTTWQYFEYTLTASETEANARVGLGNLGLSIGTVWLGNISFRPGGRVGLLAGEDLGGAGIGAFKNGLPEARTLAARKDWLRFLLATEESYWLGMRNFLKNTLGLQSLLMGTVQGCSTPNLQAAFDAIDTHYYWQHPAFPGNPWDPVDWYVNNTAMPDSPEASSAANSGLQAVWGKPHSLTEINAPYPNLHEADILLITAAYAGLQDWDAIYPYAYWGSQTGWQGPDLGGYFDLAHNTVKMAGMPAAAMAFRRGDFAASPSVAIVPMSRADEVDQLATGQAWRLVDANTAGEDRQAPLVRRVRQLVEGQSPPAGALAPGSSGPFASVINAETGQLKWDTGGGQGLVTGLSPRTQFLAGFAQGKALSGGLFLALTVNSMTTGDYAVLSLSSLDGLSLTASGHALLTVLGLQRATGTNYYQYPNTPVAYPPAKGLQITLRNQANTGPMQVEGISVDGVLQTPYGLTQIWALGPRGERVSALPLSNVGGYTGFSLSAASQALHYEVVVAYAGYTPTITRTVTPQVSATVTRTITPTYSPTPLASLWVWEDNETGWVPQLWQAYIDTALGGTITALSRITTTAASSGGIYAQELRFNSGASGNWGGGWMIRSPYGTRESLGWQALSNMQVLDITVWTDQPNLRVRPGLTEAGNTTTAVQGADGEEWESANGAWTVLPANTWVTLSFPLAQFRDKPGWPYTPTSLGNNTLDLSAIAWVKLDWDGGQGSNITLRVDNVKFRDSVFSPTPSPTPSSPTPTPSPIPATPSATPSPTLTPGILKIHESQCVPHPANGPRYTLAFNLESPAEFMELWVYSGNLQRLVTQRFSGPYQAGWNRLTLEQAGLPKGVNYYVLQAGRGEARAKSGGRLVVLP